MTAQDKDELPTEVPNATATQVLERVGLMPADGRAMCPVCERPSVLVYSLDEVTCEAGCVRQAVVSRLADLGRLAPVESVQMLVEGWVKGLRNHRDPKSRARVTCLADVQARDVGWLWPGRLPAGMISVLDGPPGVGKSTVVVDLVARLTTGRPLPNEEGSRSAVNVVLLGHEDSPQHTIRPRLDAAGADPSRVHLLMSIGDRHPRLPDDIDEIRRVIRDTDAKLLVVDPVSAYVAADMHRDNDVRTALASLGTMAEETGVAVLLVRHLRKSGGTDALGRGLGSIAIIALARAGLMLLVDPDDPQAKILAWSKMSVGPCPPSLRWRLRTGSGTPGIAWEGIAALSANDILARQDKDWAGGEGDRTALAEAKDFLREALSNGPIPATDIVRDAKGVGISETTLRRAGTAIGVEAKKQSFSGKWEWSLPKAATNGAWTSSEGAQSVSSSKSSPIAGIPQDGQDGQSCVVGGKVSVVTILAKGARDDLAGDAAGGLNAANEMRSDSDGHRDPETRTGYRPD